MIFVGMIDHGGKTTVQKFKDAQHYLECVRFHLSADSRDPMPTVHENVELIKSLGAYAFYRMWPTEYHAADALASGSVPSELAQLLDADLQRVGYVKGRDLQRSATQAPKAGV